MENSLTEAETRANHAGTTRTRHSLAVRRALDASFVLYLPLHAGFEFVALGRPTLPILAGLEFLPLLWFLKHRREFPRSVPERCAWISSGLLSLVLFLGLSLPRLSGELPSFIRYELSIALGALHGGVPLGSLATGGLALGLCHLGGLRLAGLVEVSDAEGRRLHALYFFFTALLAHLTIVRYAGGPFFD